MRTEIRSVPHIFKYEIAIVYARVDGNPIERIAKLESMTASMESPIFAYVLLIVCYHHTGQRSKMLRTLSDLVRYINKKKEENRLFNVCHKLNLLAQCYYICGFVNFAVKTLGETALLHSKCSTLGFGCNIVLIVQTHTCTFLKQNAL